MAKKTTSAPALDLDSEDVHVEVESAETPAADPVVAAERTAAQVEAFEEQAREVAKDPAPMYRQGDDSRPFCSKHNCLMKATSSAADLTRYACPVPLCDQKEKKVRAAVKIPREPSPCPDIRCRGKKSFLEVDLPRSTTAHLSMVCPSCAFEIKVPRPMYNSGQRVYERDAEDLSAR